MTSVMTPTGNRLAPTVTTSNSEWKMALARWYARQRGWKGRSGGWIYDGKGKPIVQGYWGLYVKYSRQIWSAFWGDAYIDREAAAFERWLNRPRPS